MFHRDCECARVKLLLGCLCDGIFREYHRVEILRSYFHYLILDEVRYQYVVHSDAGCKVGEADP